MSTSNSYEVPSWAGKPASGLHLDIFKDDKFIQKIMIDEKKCYFFGRNPELNDFRIDHASCSRVHAALIYHKHLNISYLVDLGSTHGTFIGSIRLEPQKPTVVQVGANFHFGASTRMYVLREKVKAQNIVEDIPIGSDLALPNNEEEIDEMTEYNTAHNRKISTIGISDTHHVVKKGVKRKSVHFNEEEIIINPEDVDPSIGRFRNLVQSTVIIQTTNKRMRIDGAMSGNFNLPTSSASNHEHKHILHHPIISAPPSGLYTGLNEPVDSFSSTNFLLPNPAPEIDSIKPAPSSSVQFKHDDNYTLTGDDHEPRKKKYKKETWHGVKKPVKAFGDI